MSTAVAFPDMWGTLEASRREWQECSTDVEELKRTCERDCGKRHVFECERCYGLILQRMKERYTDSSEMEWFIERTAFISELDGMFKDAQAHHNNLQAIEARVEMEKEAWYRLIFRKYPDFLQIAEDGPPLYTLQDMLSDPECGRNDLINAMWRGIGKPDDWQQKFQQFMDEFAPLEQKNEQLRELYLKTFFLDESGQPLQHSQEYVEDFKQNQQKTIHQVAAEIAFESQKARSSQPQRDSHAKRLDELRRAKTAFEQNRAQAKRLQNQAQSMPVKEEFKELPSCSVCKNAVQRNDVISCSLCQASLQMAGKGSLTLYCSEQCFQNGHPIHVESRHECVAGPACVQITDEDTDMDGDFTNPVACKECADKRDVVIYCSERCASARITEHRTNVHGVKTDPDEIQGSVVPVSELATTVLDKENPGLKMEHMG